MTTANVIVKAITDEAERAAKIGEFWNAVGVILIIGVVLIVGGVVLSFLNFMREEKLHEWRKEQKEFLRNLPSESDLVESFAAAADKNDRVAHMKKLSSFGNKPSRFWNAFYPILMNNVLTQKNWDLHCKYLRMNIIEVKEIPDEVSVNSVFDARISQLDADYEVFKAEEEARKKEPSLSERIRAATRVTAENMKKKPARKPSGTLRQQAAQRARAQRKNDEPSFFSRMSSSVSAAVSSASYSDNSSYHHSSSSHSSHDYSSSHSYDGGSFSGSGDSSSY